MKLSLPACAALMAFGLAACNETMTDGGGGAMRTGSAQDESACLSAVAGQTGNSVQVLSSEFSQANTIVMIGVGPGNAPWRCLVSGGNVAEVMSMTNEGYL